MSSVSRKSLMWTVASGVLMIPSIASAQVTPEEQVQSDASLGDGDIIVTAQKREQRLSEVPVAVTAASAEQLELTGIQDVASLSKITPSLAVGGSLYGFQSFSLRGIGLIAQQISSAPAVSVYVDQAPIPSTAMTGSLFLDVERVEVLKGPQGTLFGQNATGGSVNIIAAKPKNEFGAGLRTEVNHYGGVFVEGFVTGPIAETLKARVALQTDQFGAWQRGYFLSKRKNGDKDRTAARLLLDWDPSDAVRFSLNVTASRDKSEGPQPQLLSFLFQRPAVLSPVYFTYPLPNDARDVEIDPGFSTRRDTEMIQASLRADFDLSELLTLTSISNYIDFKLSSPTDYDGTVLLNIRNITSGTDEHLSQELRLSGQLLEDRLNFTVGGTYSRDNFTDQRASIYGPAGEGYSALPPNAGSNLDYATRSRASAVYGNLEFEVVPDLTVSGGVRYTKTRQALLGCLSANSVFAAQLGGIANLIRASGGLPALPAGTYMAGACATINNVPNVPKPNGPGLVADGRPTLSDRKINQDNVSWRGVVDYKFGGGQLVYASVSCGYKSGLIPVQANILELQLEPVRQEELTAYELGAKFSLLDRKLRMNIAAFKYDYVDKQFYTFAAVPVLGRSAIVKNIPKSKASGIDFDMTVDPTPGLTLRGAVTYLKTEVGNFVTLNGFGVLLDVTGSPFNYAPKFSGNFDGEYRAPVSSHLEMYIGGGGQFSSSSYSDLGRVQATRLPSYVTLDARIGVASDNGWRLGLFVRNFTDKYYWTSVNYGGDQFSRIVGTPRLFGVSAGISF